MGVPIDRFNTEESFDLEECECCGSKSVINKKNVDVISPGLKEDELDVSVCMVCGDSKTIERIEEEDYSIKRITYQVSLETPLQILEKIAKKPVKEDKKHFLMGGDEVKESKFHTFLSKRRNILRSVVLN